MPPRTKPAAAAIASTSAPEKFSRVVTTLDRRRYLDFRAGVSVAELATRENVRVDTIERSIQKMISEQAQFSQEAAEVASRQLFMETLPDTAASLSAALTATTPRVQRVVTERYDERTGETKYVEEDIVEFDPDHKTRLQAINTRQRLLTSIMPKTPMVQVDARQQTVNQGIPLGSGQQSPLLGSGGSLSAEAIIMRIRAERGLAATDQAALGSGSDKPIVNMDVDFELRAEMEEEGEEAEVLEAEQV